MLRNSRVWHWAGAMLLAVTVAANAQEGGPGNTRLLVTQVRVKPAMIDAGPRR